MGSPWASGPGELLRHGLSLLKKDNDSNRRLAMISIDNSVELMIKTFLGLPNRITGLKITRKEYQEFSESFPLLLDALEKYAVDKILGLNLGEIEWYHRLRNELYHQGNGLTVERDKISIYAELANLLFENLFGEKLLEPKEFSSALLGDFMAAWIELEKASQPVVVDGGRNNRIYFRNVDVFQKKGFITQKQLEDYINIRKIRNEVVHGKINAEDVITEEIVRKTKEIVAIMIGNQDRFNEE